MSGMGKIKKTGPAPQIPTASPQHQQKAESIYCLKKMKTQDLRTKKIRQVNKMETRMSKETLYGDAKTPQNLLFHISYVPLPTSACHKPKQPSHTDLSSY
jgi:hypothetical protein